MRSQMPELFNGFWVSCGRKVQSTSDHRILYGNSGPLGHLPQVAGFCCTECHPRQPIEQLENCHIAKMMVHEGGWMRGILGCPVLVS